METLIKNVALDCDATVWTDIAKGMKHTLLHLHQLLQLHQHLPRQRLLRHLLRHLLRRHLQRRHLPRQRLLRLQHQRLLQLQHQHQQIAQAIGSSVEEMVGVVQLVAKGDGRA